ncbi:MAG: GNAT family N-acyltransferase [Elusimicrobiota bacterium]|nr:GNAT family N-acyltransferase [Elusimicrobiota bacterium]
MERDSLFVEIVKDGEAVREAQRLRWGVFALEMGARLDTPEPGLDADRYDEHAAHVIVREGRGGRAVACLRVITQEGAMAAGGFYSQSEFEMSRLLAQPGRVLEVGRTCVSADRRDGATLSALWSGLAQHARATGAQRLLGCASVAFDPETQALAPLTAHLSHRLVAEELRVRPLRPAPRDPDMPSGPAKMPALLAAYLRLGAQICGEPCWDPAFGTADYLIVVPVESLAKRYARRFLGREAGEAACAS